MDKNRNELKNEIVKGIIKDVKKFLKDRRTPEQQAHAEMMEKSD